MEPRFPSQMETKASGRSLHAQIDSLPGCPENLLLLCSTLSAGLASRGQQACQRGSAVGRREDWAPGVHHAGICGGILVRENLDGTWILYPKNSAVEAEPWRFSEPKKFDGFNLFCEMIIFLSLLWCLRAHFGEVDVQQLHAVMLRYPLALSLAWHEYRSDNEEVSNGLVKCSTRPGSSSLGRSERAPSW